MVKLISHFNVIFVNTFSFILLLEIWKIRFWRIGCVCQISFGKFVELGDFVCAQIMSWYVRLVLDSASCCISDWWQFKALWFKFTSLIILRYSHLNLLPWVPSLYVLNWLSKHMLDWTYSASGPVIWDGLELLLRLRFLWHDKNEVLWRVDLNCLSVVHTFYSKIYNGKLFKLNYMS